MALSGVTPRSIGIDLEGSFRVLVPKGTTVPARHSFTVPTVKSQSGLEVLLLEGESPRTAGNEMLRRVVLDSSQVAAADRYPVVFTVFLNAKSEIKIDCRAQSTGRKLKIAVETPADQEKSADAQGKPQTGALDGKLETQVSVPAKAPPIDDGWGTVYVLLDCSGSMGEDRLDQIKSGVAGFAKEATKTYRVGLVRFDTHATLLCEPTIEVSRLEGEAKTIVASGATNMAEAISLARTRLNERAGARAILIVTDGRPTSLDDCVKEAGAAKQDGIQMIAIGTSEAQETLLKELASKPELGRKVPSGDFSGAISSSCDLLPKPKIIKPGK